MSHKYCIMSWDKLRYWRRASLASCPQSFGDCSDAFAACHAALYTLDRTHTYAHAHARISIHTHMVFTWWYSSSKIKITIPQNKSFFKSIIFQARLLHAFALHRIMFGSEAGVALAFACALRLPFASGLAFDAFAFRFGCARRLASAFALGDALPLLGRCLAALRCVQCTCLCLCLSFCLWPRLGRTLWNGFDALFLLRDAGAGSRQLCWWLDLTFFLCLFCMLLIFLRCLFCMLLNLMFFFRNLLLWLCSFRITLRIFYVYLLGVNTISTTRQVRDSGICANINWSLQDPISFSDLLQELLGNQDQKHALHRGVCHELSFPKSSRGATGLEIITSFQTA